MSDDEETFSNAEVARALARLSGADLVRLSELARVWARKLDASFADDLLNEAIQRVLDARRRWPVSLDLLTFMSGTMRSIADEWRRKAAREATTEPTQLDTMTVPVLGSQESAAALMQLVRRLEDVLQDHPLAMSIFRHRAMGATQREICAALGLDGRTYDTAYRRLQRELLRLYPEGCP